MSTKDSGGPAFPRAPFDVNDYCGDGSPGMSLRDWFAGMAMQAIRADAAFALRSDPEQVADRAYEQADAMIAERSK